MNSRQDVKVWNGTTWVQSRFVKQSSPIGRRAVAELATFVNWLNANNARGVIGELGWPNDKNAAGDGAKWNVDAAFYLNYLASCGVRGGLDFSAWVGSSDWTSTSGVPAYVLAYYYTGATKGGTLSGAGTQTSVSEAFYPKTGPRSGVNMSDPLNNAEPGVDGVAHTVSPSGYFNSSNRGVYGTDYWWPKDADFAFLAGRGVKNVHLRFRWERIQPALMGSLDAAELARMTASIQAAWAHGITVVLCPHNGYGYILGTSPTNFDTWSISQVGTVNVNHYVDMWTKVAAAVGSLPGLRGYGLMNEPQFMACGIPSGSNMVINGSFDTDLSGGWVADAGASSVAWNSAGHSTAGSCLITTNGTRNFASVKSPRTFSVTPGEQYYLEAWFKQPATATRRYCNIGVNFYNSSGTYMSGITPSGGSRLPTTTQWMQVTNAGTVPAGAATMEVSATMTATGNLGSGEQVLVDDIVLKRCTNPLARIPLWEYLSQSVVTALRNAGDTHEIWVNGVGDSPANIPINHSTPWITDPLDFTFYDAHHYWDHTSTSGVYTQTYATELADAIAHGY